MTNQEASAIALVRFTWTSEQAVQKPAELSNKISTINF